jgi:ATP-dependent helicase HrpB
MPNNRTMPPLPVDSILDDLKRALHRRCGAVLQAPPGAGKTTRVPLALMGEPWLAGRRILLLEPRRLAARAAAFRMADCLQENIGQTVGYRVRLDTCVGPGTRIEVVTEGVLTRMLQTDPSLADTGLVVFDEFHERHLESDLGLALCLDIQGVLNEDLRLLVMSATLDAGPVARLLGAVPVIACRGRTFAVETRYIGRLRERALEKAVADAVLAAAAAEAGSILVFLPGAAEIRRVQRRLAAASLGPDWMVLPLFGNLSREEQNCAIAPPPAGRRKIVLASAIAETSLTIEGVRVVVDGGRMRVPRFDVRSGMTRLETLPVSRASADQRRGRAGRTAPGVCYRLWSEAAHGTLAEANRPDILESDLVSVALELAVWGVDDPGRLRWLDPPPTAAFTQARRLLVDLGALDTDGAVTEHGRRMAAVPLHPRLAHMILSARSTGMGAAACDLAALLSERDIVQFQPGERDADLRLRVDILHRAQENGRAEGDRRFTVDRAACRRVARTANHLKQRLGIRGKPEASGSLGRLLAWAYPERIARRRPGSVGRYLMANGRGAFFDPPDPLAASEYLVVAALDGNRREARIFLAAAYDPQALFQQFAHRIRGIEAVAWAPERSAVTAERTLQLGALALHSESLAEPDPAKVLAALCEGLRQEGIDCLPWNRPLRGWQQRVLFLRRLFGPSAEWPDVSDAALTATLADWLGSCLRGITRLRDLGRIDLNGALTALLTWPQRQRLDALAPTHWCVASGSRVPIDYSGNVPVLAVRVQEMFGTTATPVIADGRQPLLIHLLSPAGRPVQVTSDLAGFWQSGYPEVKKQLKGRYPKHFWPDNPLTAPATARAKPRKK